MSKNNTKKKKKEKERKKGMIKEKIVN